MVIKVKKNIYIFLNNHDTGDITELITMFGAVDEKETQERARRRE